MSSGPEPATQTDRCVPLASIVARALLYAAAATLVVLFAPEEGPRFIYMGF